METAILLVLLTLNPAGQPGVNFVMTDDMDTCEGKTLLLKNILTSGGIKIIENRCIPSRLKFSKYSHRPAAAVKAKPLKRRTYLVSLGKDSLQVKTIPDLKTCQNMISGQDKAGAARLYCATSIQSMM